MKGLAILIVVALALMPAAATAQPRPGRTGGGGSGPARPAQPQGQRGGFNLPNDAPANRPANAGNRTGAPNQGGFNLPQDAPVNRTPNTGVDNRAGNTNVSNRTPNTNVNNSGNTNNNRTQNTNVSNRTGNNTNVSNRTGNTNVNVSGNNVNVNRNVNVHNGYGYRGPVIVNPIYHGPAWGWNGGVAWVAAPAYWGGGFWGAFAVGAATAAVMGSIVNAATHQTYTSYQVSAGSPGAQLLSNYQLQQVPCGPPNLVVIYGPNNGVICARPNHLVAAGNYAVNADNLTLQAP